MLELYIIGILATYLTVVYSGQFTGLVHSPEMRGIPLNLLTALTMLCILFWPATWTAALICSLMEGDKK